MYESETVVENPYESPAADNPPPASAEGRATTYVKLFLVGLLIITPAMAGAFSPDGEAGEIQIWLVALFIGLVLYLLQRLK